MRILKKLKKRQNLSKKGMSMMKWVRKSFFSCSQPNCKIKLTRRTVAKSKRNYMYNTVKNTRIEFIEMKSNVKQM